MTVAASMPSVFCCGFELNSDAGCLGRMRDSSEIAGDYAALRQRMIDDGYLLLRNLLNRPQVLEARRAVLSRLAEEGQLDGSTDVMEGVLRAGSELYFRPDLAALPAVGKVLYDGAMMEFFAGFLGAPVLHYDYTWLRSVAPDKGTSAHCDIVYMGRGTRNLYTAWTPLGDNTVDLGGLMVLEGSHKHNRLRQTYGRKDVDAYCINGSDAQKRKILEARGYNGRLSDNPVQIQRSLGGRWLTTDFFAGDVVIFSCYLVHAGTDNRSGNRIRLSTDSRYQLASEPADERWMGPNPPAHGPEGKRGKIC
jgi:ectoine hydroxylase-related dioxygenase (phytanoyl-CoA dioxygenase family)